MKKYFKGAIARARFYASTMGFIETIDALTEKQLRNTVR
jgi:hypothetical protein